MRPRSSRWLVPAGLAAALAAFAGPAAAQDTGPNTTTKPYVLPVADGVSTKSILTVEDGGYAGTAASPYEMAGIPDGLGVRDNPDGPGFTVLMNHEIRPGAGAVRRHGQNGAFVSKLNIRGGSFRVTEGSDFIDPGVTFYDYIAQTFGSTPSTGGPNPRQPADAFAAQGAAFSRFCSSSLTDRGQLLNRRSGRGYDGRIYFANEETGDEGRLFGVLEDGTAQQLPRLGLFSWENTLAAANRTDTTLVMGNEDTDTGQLWAYVGTKQRSGSAFDKAGLTNGGNHVLDIADSAVKTDAEFRAAYGKGKAVGFNLNGVDWDQSGASQNREAAADGITLNRVEDGAWDPRNPDDYYFLTTEGGAGADPTPVTGRDGGGLWKVSFEDRERPQLGGTIELVLDGSEEPLLNKPDNMDIDSRGNLLIQEDPGGNAHVARVLSYQMSTGKLGVLAEFDRAQFAPVTPGGTDAPFTIDEESSGIIDASEVLGRGWYLFDAQVHEPTVNPDYVQHGQLLAMRVRSFRDVYGG